MQQLDDNLDYIDLNNLLPLSNEDLVVLNNVYLYDNLQWTDEDKNTFFGLIKVSNNDQNETLPLPQYNGGTQNEILPLPQDDGDAQNELLRLIQFDNSDQNDRPLSFQLNDSFQNEIELFLQQLIDNDQSHSQTADGDTPAELFQLLPNALEDANAIIDNEQEIQTVSIPQQANGSDKGIMYQMAPSIIDNIDGTLSVKQQPKANNRPRPQSEGTRFLPGSKKNPMSINLPENLQLISLAPNQTLGIVSTMVTTADNPKEQTIVHANDIFCREPDAVKIGYGSVFVPLSRSDNQNGEKKYKRFSIVQKKCDECTFDITPFSVAAMFGTTEKYTVPGKAKIGNAAKGKLFKKDYNLSSYKIIFHLALKENNVVYISNKTCETDIITDERVPQQSGKRSNSASTVSFSEEESSSDVQISSPPKKFKASPPSGLPITRVSNRDTTSEMDDSSDIC